MDLTQLANLGEFIGGVAVLVTLIYLATQVRQSNNLEQNESHRNWVRDWNSVVLAPMLDIKFSDLVRRCARDFESVTGPEKQTMNAFWGGAFFLIEEVHILGGRGHLDDDLVAIAHHSGASILRVPGIGKWWEAGQVHYTSGFREKMNALIVDDSHLPAYHQLIPWFIAENSGSETR